MTVRHTDSEETVTGPMAFLRAALPIVRPLLLAVVATLLILIGLPALLAAGAAGGG